MDWGLGIGVQRLRFRPLLGRHILGFRVQGLGFRGESLRTFLHQETVKGSEYVKELLNCQGLFECMSATVPTSVIKPYSRALYSPLYSPPLWNSDYGECGHWVSSLRYPFSEIVTSPSRATPVKSLRYYNENNYGKTQKAHH